MKGERVWMQDHPLYGWTPAVVVSLSANTNLRLITIKSPDNVVCLLTTCTTAAYAHDGLMIP